MIDRSNPPQDPSNRNSDFDRNRKRNDELLRIPAGITRGELLLNAIREDPNSANLRLAYADWLEHERGNSSLASFIRAGVEFSTTNCPDRREDRRAYCDDWVLDHWETFFEGAPTAKVPGVEVFTRLGLPEEVSFKWNAISSIPHEELRWLLTQPVVTSISLPGTVSQHEFQRVTAFCEGLRHLTLSIETDWPNALTRGMFRSRLEKLETLTIQGACSIDPRIVAELASFAPNIQEISLKSCALAGGVFAQNLSPITSLKVLEINRCSGLQKVDLCTLPALMPNLEVLSGNGISFPNGGWVELPGNAWPCLDALTIEHSTGLVASDIDALLRAAPALRGISFSGSDLEGGIFVEASTGESFGRVKYLDLSYLPNLGLRDYTAVREIFPEAQIYMSRKV